jgi:chromosome segregation ATPase
LSDDAPKDLDPNAETDDERDARIHDLSRERPAPERVERSDTLEEMRTDRAAALEDTRQQRASDLRVQQALRDAKVDGDLAAHETRLKAINGSIDRTVTGLSELRGEVGALVASVNGIVETQKDQASSFREHTEVTSKLGALVKDVKDDLDRRDAVAAAIVKADKDKGSKRMSRISVAGFALAVMTGVASFAFGLIAVIHGGI